MIIISLVLVILVTFSCCVNATEINETLENTNDTADKINENDNDFTSLYKEINQSSTVKEIKLTKNYMFNENTDEKYISGIAIDIDSFIIDGQGHTIDGVKKARIFNIKSNNVTLKNINIINGVSDMHGGAIYCSGLNGKIINSNFKECYAPSCGGAIYFKNSGSITDSVFGQNNGTFGGAVNFEETGNVTNSRFINNFATYLGGGISSYGLLTVTNTYFSDNIASDGGGIYSSQDCKIENSIFNRNNAIGYGGAITNDYEAIINNVSFTNNTGKYAGAIYLKSSGYINNSNFIQNYADSGGAIMVLGNSIELTNSEFDHNNALKAKSIYIQTKTAKIDKCSFYNVNSSYKSEIILDCKNSSTDNLLFEETKKEINKDDNTKTEIITPKNIKKSTIISAKSKTFKTSKKIKKLTITLKYNKKIPLSKKKVILKIKNRKYIGKTNSKGKIIFKIKLNKKGKYKATIQFNGDTQYSSSKKTVLIKIKK